MVVPALSRTWKASAVMRVRPVAYVLPSVDLPTVMPSASWRIIVASPSAVALAPSAVDCAALAALAASVPAFLASMTAAVDARSDVLVYEPKSAVTESLVCSTSE